MTVHDIRKPTSDILSTLAPINVLLKVVGLSCLSSGSGKLTYSWSSRKVIFLIFLYIFLSCSCIYFKFMMESDDRTFNFSDSVQISYLFDLVHYCADITFVYKYGRQRCVDYYSTYQQIDRVLGEYFYIKIRKSIIKMCSFLLAIWLVAMIVDYITWSMVFGWMILFAYFMDAITLGLKTFSYLDVISNCVQIEYRLKAIEDYISCIYCSMENQPEIIKEVVCAPANRNNKRNNLNLECIDVKPVSIQRSNVVPHLNRCYLLLLEQCDYINIMFGYRIILGNLAFLLNIIILVNVMARIITGTLMPGEELGYFPVISTAMRLFVYAIIPFCMIHCCERTYKQTNKIGRMIDLTLMNKKMSVNVRDTLKQLRDLVHRRPVNFTAVNFYRLEYPALVSLVSAIVTYSILLLQHVR